MTSFKGAKAPLNCILIQGSVVGDQGSGIRGQGTESSIGDGTTPNVRMSENMLFSL